MSSRSGSSRSSSSESTQSSDGSITRYRSHRLPNTFAVNCLKYCTGRNPRKVKGVRVYETTYPEPDYEIRSNGSRPSSFSWIGSRKRKDVQIVLLESRHYYDWDGYESDDSEVVITTKRKISSRTSHHSGGPWPRNPPGVTVVDVDDDEDSDTEASDINYGHPPMPPPPMGPGRHPGMHPTMNPAMRHAPPGTFQAFHPGGPPRPGGNFGPPGPGAMPRFPHAGPPPGGPFHQ